MKIHRQTDRKTGKWTETQADMQASSVALYTLKITTLGHNI